MLNLKAIAPFIALSTSLLLSGCFVTSTNPPLANGPANDEALVGDWRGIDADSGKEDDVFVHIQRPEADKPLRVVFVENKDYQVYEMQTARTGSRNAFAAKLISPPKSTDQVPNAFFIGYYETKQNEIVFHLLDAEKIRDLINSGKVQGIPGKGKYDFSQLTGSSKDISQFLASPEAWMSRAEGPARLKRISRAE